MLGAVPQWSEPQSMPLKGKTMLKTIAKFQTNIFHFRSERGATAVEYGLIVALIAAVIVVVVATLGQRINGAFGTVNNKV